jgi:peptidyl-prolyl cis-trans isomerase SurA
MWDMARFFAGLLLLATCLSVSPARAQDLQRIVAVVNDDVISLYDLATRTRLNIASSGLEDNATVRRQVQSQTLRALIDERLQAQEAQRLNLSISQAEIDAAISRIEQQNRMQPGQIDSFLGNVGLDRSVLGAQIRAQLLWQKVVNRRLRTSLEVGADEIDEQLDRLKSNQGQTEYLLAEIFLSVDSPDQDEEVRQNGMNLIEQMRRGASFSGLAQQFSQSASASGGGDIGWVPRGQLEKEVEDIVDQLRPMNVTEPIRTIGGYYVYLLRQRRVVAGPSPDDAKVQLSQFLLPLDASASEAEINVQKDMATTLRESVGGCADLTRLAKEMGVPEPAEMPSLRVGDLAPNLRPVIADLKVGEFSPPLRTEQGLMLLMVCVREEAPSNLPSREEITEALTRQRLDLMARRYLRDLRRAAVVDVRA